MTKEDFYDIYSASVKRHQKVRSMLRRKKLKKKKLDPDNGFERMLIEKRREQLKHKMRALG